MIVLREQVSETALLSRADWDSARIGICSLVA